MYLKIKKADLIPDSYGQKISISMIGLYDDNDKWIRWIKLNEETITVLTNSKLTIKNKKNEVTR